MDLSAAMAAGCHAETQSVCHKAIRRHQGYRLYLSDGGPMLPKADASTAMIQVSVLW